MSDANRWPPAASTPAATTAASTMAPATTAANPFEPATDRWLEVLGAPRDVVRQELVRRQLTAHLPPRRQTVLDVGCGQGTQALELANLGHRVTGIDVSERMLSLAKAAQKAAGLEAAFEYGDALHLAASHPGPYDVVCCHGVAMYLPSLTDLVASLISVTAEGGLVSLLTRNRFGIAMRSGLAGNWDDAVASFDARTYRNRIGVEAARADEPGEVAEAFNSAGGTVVAWYGVRLFTDHWQGGGAVTDALIDAEAQACRRDPYRSVAALTHTIAKRDRLG